jgi:endonuclease I
MKLLTIILVWLSVAALGQIPQGYYNGTAGLSGQELRGALMQIIDDHQEQSYASLWTHFLSTDPDENGKVWDMYSDIPGGNPAYVYTFIQDQCGNYSAEGDCYNREHSFPKSWFDDAAPMVTDLFQIYPTDGYVNGKRSNYPYGEVNNPSWTSTNGSKVGVCSCTGYSGIVFEPINEYKGDFARTYFYMMTRYMSLVNSWNSDMLDGGDFAGWAAEMLLEWHENDPVSQKETDRNEAVYLVQDNRNPFIDHPEFSEMIWGSNIGIDNPASEQIDFRIERNRIVIGKGAEKIDNIIIYNVLGQPLIQSKVDGEYNEIPLDLKSGIYFIIINGKSFRINQKVFISGKAS